MGCALFQKVTARCVCMQVIEPPKKVAQTRAVPSMARGQKISFGNKVSPHCLLQSPLHARVLYALLLCNSPAELDCTPPKEMRVLCTAFNDVMEAINWYRSGQRVLSAVVCTGSAKEEV